MLNVFVCEDNEKEREKLLNIIENTIIIKNLDIKLALSTGDPDEVFDYIRNERVTGLYFLDVDLRSHINGIQLADKIRKYDPNGFIVFITTHSEMSYLTFVYKVEAMDYIAKDDYSSIRQRICDCIVNSNDRYCSKVDDFEKKFNFRIEDKIISIEYNEILFFETSRNVHKIILHSVNRQLEFYAKMSEIEKILDKDIFYRCHKSFIVNKNNVKEIDTRNREAYMINGEKCLISIRALKGLIEIINM